MNLDEYILTGDKILVEEVKKDEVVNGIIYKPEPDQNMLSEYKLIKTSPVSKLRVGDKVVALRALGTRVSIKGRELKVMGEKNLFATQKHYIAE